ncbi:MAG: hypothetical protein HYR63_18980 [Proteobacteria bacterium]|nr:hypothetical protein [Pseudomonadota bacterium]MBI3498715.1 hypothetical protein [Pseudomonadota bacterium]
MLNYISTGEDEGSIRHFWWAKDKKNCVYALSTFWISGDMAQLDKEETILKLNDVDPRNVKIEYDPEGPFRVNFDRQVILTEAGSFKMIFGNQAAPRQADDHRILRGLELIYGTHCKGKKKAF